jgi:hypothetical protein
VVSGLPCCSLQAAEDGGVSYELRIAYDVDTTLGEGDVRSRHETIEEAAVAFVTCTAPCKQIIYLCKRGEPSFLDQDDEAVLRHVCALYGLELVEVGDDAG